MGKSIQKKWFGKYIGSQITMNSVKFSDNQSFSDAYIIKQVGTSAYIVKDKNDTHDSEIIFLTNATDASGLQPGQGFILAKVFDGPILPVKKILQHKVSVYSVDGTIDDYLWKLTDNISFGQATLNPSVINTAPRYGIGSADAYQSGNVETLFAGMATIPNSTNESRSSGPFTVTPPIGNYGWVAILQSACVTSGLPTGYYGATFTDELGAGGWQGAGLPSNNTGASPSLNYSNVTYAHTSGTYVLFRQDYSGSSFTGSIS